MRQSILLVLLVIAAGCQIDVMDPARGKTIVPDTKARLARTLRLGEDGREVWLVNQYTYNDAGRLERIDWLNKDASGKMVIYTYETYTYGTDARLVWKTTYSRWSNAGEFRANAAIEYSYPAANQTVETNYSINGNTGVRTPSSRTETINQNGRTVQTNHYYFNNTQQLVPSGNRVYSYADGRLITEEYRDATGKLYSTNRYVYKGRTAQIEVSSPNSTSSRIAQSLLYDSRGRLIRQQYMGTTDYYPLYLSSSSYVANYTIVFEYLD